MTQTMKQNKVENENGELTRDVTVFVPRVDIWENDDEIVLFADMPGADLNGVDINFEDRQLTIHAKVNSRLADKSFIGGEYGIGDFHRTFTIGESIDVEQISAEFKNGVLTVRLPKSESVKPRKITVKAG